MTAVTFQPANINRTVAENAEFFYAFARKPGAFLDYAILAEINFFSASSLFAAVNSNSLFWHVWMNCGGTMRFKLGKLSLFFLLVSIHLLATNIIGYGQEQKYPRGAQYFLGTDDQLLIKVNIWGFVAKPGQYMVPSDTDLISLISFAGGPRDGAKLNSIKIIRTRNTTDSTEVVITVNVKEFIKNGNESLIPQLHPGDTIIISGSTWYHIGNFLGFVTKIATLVQIYWWIVYYSR